MQLGNIKLTFAPYQLKYYNYTPSINTQSYFIHCFFTYQLTSYFQCVFAIPSIYQQNISNYFLFLHVEMF